MGAGEDGFEAAQEGCFAVVFGEDFDGEAFVLEAAGHGACYWWISGYECGFCVVEEVRPFEAVELLLEEGSVEVGESLFGGCGLGLVEEADAEEGPGEAVAADFFGAGGEVVVVEGWWAFQRGGSWRAGSRSG